MRRERGRDKEALQEPRVVIAVNGRSKVSKSQQQRRQPRAIDNRRTSKERGEVLSIQSKKAQKGKNNKGGSMDQEEKKKKRSTPAKT